MTRLIEMGIDGFSTTVFCYGQTGSGKTHTLTGPPYLVSFSSSVNFNEDGWMDAPAISLVITECAMVDTVYMNNGHAVDQLLVRYMARY